MALQSILCKNTAPGIKRRLPSIHPLIQQIYIEHLVYASPAGKRETVVNEKHLVERAFWAGQSKPILSVWTKREGEKNHPSPVAPSA